MKIFMLSLVVFFLSPFPVSAMFMRNTHPSEETFYPLKVSKFAKYIFLIQCNKEKEANKNATILAKKIEESPGDYYELLTSLAQSDKLIHESVAYKTLVILLKQKNEWIKKNLINFVIKKRTETLFGTFSFFSKYKTKNIYTQNVNNTQKFVLGVAGKWLRNVRIGPVITEYEMIGMELIKSLCLSYKQQENDAALEILPIHCVRQLFLESHNKGNNQTRWPGRFIVTLSQSKATKDRTFCNKVLVETLSYMKNSEKSIEDQIKLYFSDDNNNNLIPLTKEDRRFEQFLLKGVIEYPLPPSVDDGQEIKMMIENFKESYNKKQLIDVDFCWRHHI